MQINSEIEVIILMLERLKTLPIATMLKQIDEFKSRLAYITEIQFDEEEIDEIEDQSQSGVEEKANPLHFKLFGLYDVSNIVVRDPGMKRYINVEPKLLVKGYGRIREKFGKGKVNILELFANLVAVPGHRGKKHKIQTSWKSGKYTQNMKIVLDTNYQDH